MKYIPGFRLDRKVAIVTGASSGLGKHIALSLAESGADLAVVGRSAKVLEEVADEARGMGVRAVAVVADLSNGSAGQEVTARTVDQLGRVDILVNNAGTNVQQSTLDVTPEVWDQITNLNLKGSFFMAQAVARRMVEQGSGGRIINIASQMAEVGFYKRAVYCASKSGMVGFTRAMAVELARYGIRVNALGPTFIDSPLAREMFKDKDIEQEVMNRLPIQRLGHLHEVSTAVVFLASDGADLVTGHHLLVDGGWTAW